MTHLQEWGSSFRPVSNIQYNDVNVPTPLSAGISQIGILQRDFSECADHGRLLCRLPPMKQTSCSPQALTASATARVQKDILQSLKMDPKYLYRCVEPFNRTNLYYEVSDSLHFAMNTLKPPRLQVRYRPEPDHDRLEDVKAYILALHKRAPPNDTDPTKRPVVSGIIYCRSKALVSPSTLSCCVLISVKQISATPFRNSSRQTA